jgi:hypothetical protein
LVLIMAHLLHIVVLLLCYYIKIESSQWSHSFSRTVLLSRSVLQADTYFIVWFDSNPQSSTPEEKHTNQYLHHRYD